MKSSFRLFVPGLMALLLAACASPQTRIDKNPEAFNSLPAEQQALIKVGKIGIGFDETAVKLAMGEPDRITQRTDANGVSLVWRYTRYEDQLGAPLYTGFYHRGFAYPFNSFYGSGFYGPGAGFYPYYLSSNTRQERDHVRVVFSDNKVSAIEEEVK
ncbi:hypothetical protein [uncultured Nevskia sp.]|uniref:hypothetical protein n=1 Tax=uncultured Nevskia sp. TaxID=228950 RepID=UPI0025F7585E|nr:hypothetical protein [uncultured Nevskia sp.]